MYTLLLDSSNVELIVGLAKDNTLIDEIRYNAWQKQSEFMVSEIDKIFKRNSVDPKSINEVVVSYGPGSYTGLRIALTIAKIYSLSLNIPLYKLSSLQILEKRDETSICLMNARSSRSYIGIYKNKECLLSDRVLTNEEVLKIINDNPTYKVCGEVSYLNLTSEVSDTINTMLYLKSEENKVEDVLSLKALYLKD